MSRIRTPLTPPPKWFGMWSNRASGSVLKPWFYTWSLLSRLVRPGSTLYLATQPPSIRALAAHDPAAGTWTFVLVNRQPGLAQGVTVKVPGSGVVKYDRYLFNGIDGSGPRDANGFPLPVASGRIGSLDSGIAVTIPANSVAFITAEPPNPVWCSRTGRSYDVYPDEALSGCGTASRSWRSSAR